MQAPEEILIRTKVQSILGNIRGGTHDIDGILRQVKTKLAEQRAHDAALKAAVDSTGWPKKPVCQSVLEALVAQKCGKRAEYFELARADQRKQKEMKERADALQAEKERKAQDKLRATIEKHVERSAITTGNINLTEYSETNLRLLAGEHADKLTPPTRAADGSITAGVAMAAAVYDRATNRYFVGKSGMGRDNASGNVPAVIWNAILGQTVNVKDDAFGTNCAEVDCLYKAFKARAGAGIAPANSLRDMTFVAYKVGEGKCRGPCHTCKAWLTAYHAGILMPH